MPPQFCGAGQWSSAAQVGRGHALIHRASAFSYVPTSRGPPLWDHRLPLRPLCPFRQRRPLPRQRPLRSSAIYWRRRFIPTHLRQRRLGSHSLNQYFRRRPRRYPRRLLPPFRRRLPQHLPRPRYSPRHLHRPRPSYRLVAITCDWYRPPSLPRSEVKWCLKRGFVAPMGARCPVAESSGTWIHAVRANSATRGHCTFRTYSVGGRHRGGSTPGGRWASARTRPSRWIAVRRTPAMTYKLQWAKAGLPCFQQSPAPAS